jgi:hypothetical protein
LSQLLLLLHNRSPKSLQAGAKTAPLLQMTDLLPVALMA